MIDDDDATPVLPLPRRDPRLLALLDAARDLAVAADLGAPFRGVALDALERAVLAWGAEKCATCGRRGDHEWEELTHAQRVAHEAEATRRGP